MQAVLQGNFGLIQGERFAETTQAETTQGRNDPDSRIWESKAADQHLCFSLHR